ncbi:unnamed protein product [Acanthoscelides obtectus]|uniref:PiggyBac transposable element-derived protein domain-containing protein n=1 Tax=Acanthoscelides obtectus TaxID=200917 RepID=A0A9P0LET4_ACAOB|nr:unnamed protein product [Acanthoscelides obtectus]CAK1631730.1 PiggyBac transposable element-derived protein 4 [Acanthoscelides obtectus]
MEITKNLQNTGALPTDVDTQTNTPENEIEIIEAESSDDENQINSPGRNYLTSGDEFSDFGSDDSIIDKDYYPSSSDSDENPHNLFDDTIEGSAAEVDDFDSNTADENEANDTTDDENGNMPHVGLDTNNWQDIVEDNFYSSLPLAKKLYEEKIVYCGTLRANRKGIPKSFQKKLKKGETYGQQNGCVKIIKWVDKRPVLMLTTNPTHISTVEATGKKSRKGEDIVKPKCVTDYNKAKKGVDYSDQMSSYHSVLRRGLKWYRKVMNEFLFGTCIVNAWIIFNRISKKKMSITEFRKTLAEQLRDPPTVVSEPTTRKRIHTFRKPTGPGRKKKGRFVEDAIKTFGQLYPAVKQIRKSPK